ncbi:hypothetical protein [Dactylosporangium sp. CA-139066]|uniref:hypothetical protein n=1 Tax=Dactylosporangium sp. CA-139066 TaxID=3239930 RepID=UPI003D8E1613
MGIAFGLAVNFGVDQAAAWTAQDLVRGAMPLTAGRRQVGLHEPAVCWETDADDVPYLLMSVLPIGIGRGLPVDRGHELVRLPAAALTELGHQLYRLLGRFTGYRAAQVGWDPFTLVDLAELRRECVEGLQAGTIPGLVLAENILPEARGTVFKPFVPEFVWIPYAGERPSTLTTDGDNLVA